MANQIQLVMYEGFLAAAPEMRYTPKGTGVTNFRMGSNRSYKTADGNAVKETTWLKVVAWGKLGEIVNQYCDQGSHVIVTGILRVGEDGSPKPYQRGDGTWAASYEITAREIRIIKGKDNGGQTQTEVPAVEDDLPF